MAALLSGVLAVAAASCSNSSRPGVAYASVSVKCGDDVYTVTTGNSGGKCSTTKGSKGTVESATCEDGQGNGAAATCNSAIGACGNASGSGSCSIKAPG